MLRLCVSSLIDWSEKATADYSRENGKHFSRWWGKRNSRQGKQGGNHFGHARHYWDYPQLGCYHLRVHLHNAVNYSTAVRSSSTERHNGSFQNVQSGNSHSRMPERSQTSQTVWTIPCLYPPEAQKKTVVQWFPYFLHQRTSMRTFVNIYYFLRCLISIYMLARKSGYRNFCV